MKGNTHSTPWAVICPVHGSVELTRDQYMAQLERPDSLWRCPACGRAGQYDEDNDPTITGPLAKRETLTEPDGPDYAHPIPDEEPHYSDYGGLSDEDHDADDWGLLG